MQIIQNYRNVSVFDSALFSVYTKMIVASVVPLACVKYQVRKPTCASRECFGSDLPSGYSFSSTEYVNNALHT